MFPTFEDQCSLPKRKRKEKGKRKRKRKEEKEKEIVVKLCLEARTLSEGYMAKAFEARCPKPIGWESST